MANLYLVTTKNGNKKTYSAMNFTHPHINSHTVSIILNELTVEESFINPNQFAENEVLKYLKSKGSVELITKIDTSDIKSMLVKLKESPEEKNNSEESKLKEIKEKIEKAEKLMNSRSNSEQE